MSIVHSDNGNVALATQEQRPKNTLATLLESRRGAMQAVLPKHLTAERLIKIALVAVSKTPKLMECTPETVLQSVMTAAQLGLDCGGALGSAYLVPFKKNYKDGGGNWQSVMECQLIIGYRGMIDLARRSGQISSIESRIVYENDQFELSYGFETKFIHKPVLDQDAGKLRLVYAVANLKDGGTQFELMTRAQIDGIRARSKSKDNGPWVTDYEEMARKTVVKRLFKYLPVSVEMVQAVEEDNRADFGDIMGVNADAPKAIDNLNSRLKQLPDQVDAQTGEVIDAPTETQAEQPTEPQPSQSIDGNDWLSAEKSWAHIESAAASAGVSPEDFNNGIALALKKLGAGRAIKFDKSSPPWRHQIHDAIVGGTFDWATGTVA